MTSFARRIRPFVLAELEAARRASGQGDPSRAFVHLERAHVLSQSSTVLHVQVHGAMLRWGLRQRSLHEVAGQWLRLVGAATKTFAGLVPHGNTGGSNVGALRPMPIAPELQRLIDAARA